MNFKRGLIAAILCPLVGVTLFVIPITLFTIVSWKLNDSSLYDRESDIAWWAGNAVPPLMKTTIYLGLSGLATYTPNLKFRFGKTLAILFCTAIPLTAFASALPLTPRRLKGINHPEMYLSEFLVLFIPPLIVTIILLNKRRTTT